MPSCSRICFFRENFRLFANLLLHMYIKYDKIIYYDYEMLEWKMVSFNKIWKIAVASVITLALWTFISVNTGLFTKGTEFSTFDYIMSYVMVLGIWGLISLKMDFSPMMKRVSGIAAMALTPFLCMQISIIFAGIAEYSIGIYFLNILIYAAIMALFFAITRSIRWAPIITVVITYLFTLSSYVVQILRGTPLIPSDFLAIGTAVNVADQYTFQLRYPIILTSILMIFTVLMVWKFSYKITMKYKNIICPASGAAFFLAVAIPFSAVDFNNIDMDFFDQYHANNTHGMAVSFYINVRRMSLQKPDNYNEADTAALLTANTKKEPAKSTPNILVIMNESFSDLSVVGDFTTDVDYMPFIRSLKKNTVRGKLLVSPFGGYTCNSEFEFLTGMTMGLLPQGSTPYLQYLTVPQPNSICGHLKSMGYENIALHPYYARGWNREKVYGLMGFDKFISMDNMGDYQNRNEFEYIRCYMSDRTSYSAAINQFTSKNKDKPMFLFNITMQNHGGYKYNLGSWKDTVHITNMKGEYPEAEQYLSLVKESDIAFSELIDWFSAWDEPTVILMFGDHQPGIEQGFYEELYGKSLDQVNGEDMLKRYTVPFLIWANYDIEAKDNVLTSTNYLQNLLLETAGLPKGSVNNFVDKVKAEVPAINALGHYDTSGNWLNNDTLKPEILSQYKNLEYYLLTHKQQ